MYFFWTWVSPANYLSSAEFALTWQLTRNGLSLNDVAFRDAWADMTDCHRCELGLEKNNCTRLLPLSSGAPFLGLFRQVDGSYRSRTSRVRRSASVF